MGLAGSSDDVKKRSIVLDGNCEEAELESLLNGRRELSGTIRSPCCCCQHRNDLFSDNILQDIANSRRRTRLLVKIGATVHVRNYGSGTVRFNGETHFAPGFFIGVELDEPLGKHDGFYDGRRYFHARPNTGVFVRYRRLGSISDKSKDHDFLNTPQRSCRFSITLSDGLITVDVSLKEHSTSENCQIIRYPHSRVNPGFERTAKDLSASALWDKFLSVKATDNRALKLNLLLQLLENESLRLKSNQTRNASSQQTFYRRKIQSRSLKTTDENACQPDDDPPSIIRIRGTPSNSVPSVTLLETQRVTQPALAPSLILLAEASASSIPDHPKPKPSTAHLMPGNGVLPKIIDMKSPKLKVSGSFDCNDDENLSSKIGLGHVSDKLSIDASTIQDPDSGYISESSEDDVGQIALMRQDLDHERLMVKRKEERVRELEEELRGYDKELKEKTKVLTKKGKQIELLEKRCDELIAIMRKAETDAEAWQFEVLYGKGE